MSSGAIAAAPRTIWPIWPVVVALALGAGGAVGWVWFIGAFSHPLRHPYVAPRPVFAQLNDTRQVSIVTTEAWQKVTTDVPMWRFVIDHTLWRRMHFEDWDRLDASTRVAGLSRMLDRHGSLMTARDLWPSMTAHDWDTVPQPVRAMAVLGMIEDWVRYYGVGEPFGLDARLVIETAQAIAMSESWFDHRAIYVNDDGSADLGIGQASEFARRTICEWYGDGRADFVLADEDYYNPWLATRWLAFWLDLTLHEAEGDLELAVRAYHRGIGAALDGAGAEYQRAVQRRFYRYIRGDGRSPTWKLLKLRRAIDTSFGGAGAVVRRGTPETDESAPAPGRLRS